MTNHVHDLSNPDVINAIRLVRAFAINHVRYSPRSMFVTSLDTLARVAERPKITVEREIKIKRGRV